ncbi:MAG: prepilin-type N-terminal cleavage/methylation domain-containing protein [Acidimicrobiia bacterium]
MSGRLRGQSGFGLIELLMAMVMLNIGLLAVVAAFTSGMWGLARAGNISTAAALGDQQMELYRELPIACIYVTSPPTSGTYAGDPAYSTSYQGTSGTTGPNQPCNVVTLPTNSTSPNRTGVIGSDRHKYEVDTYINYRCSDLSIPTGTTPGTCGSANGGIVTLVTVVVRDGRTTSKVLNRQSSTFDPSNDLR